jgi:dCTP deaminase
LGRRGLIIATATGFHPGFTGALTLELSNVGEIPIKIYPGMKICQLFLHDVKHKAGKVDCSRFIGYRKPVLGKVTFDAFAERLAKSTHI